jgi:hypothetical protein
MSPYFCQVWQVAHLRRGHLHWFRGNALRELAYRKHPMSTSAPHNKTQQRGYRVLRRHSAPAQSREAVTTLLMQLHIAFQKH